MFGSYVISLTAKISRDEALSLYYGQIYISALLLGICANRIRLSGAC